MELILGIIAAVGGILGIFERIFSYIDEQKEKGLEERIEIQEFKNKKMEEGLEEIRTRYIKDLEKELKKSKEELEIQQMF